MKTMFMYLTAILFTIIFAITVNTVLVEIFGMPEIFCAVTGFLMGWNLPKYVLKILLPQDKQSEEIE